MVSSFRDPGGRLTVDKDGVFRHVFAGGLANWHAFTRSATVERHRLAGQIVGTRVISATGTETILEHERIPFASYPHEWPPEMLHAAAALTLLMAEGLISEGLGLKDATPHNVLFRGTNPVFVDVLSVEPRASGDPIWLASAQFMRTFVLPLVMRRELGIPLSQVFLSRRDGIEAEHVRRALPWYKRWLPPFLGLVTVPRLLSGFAKGAAYGPARQMDDEMARFILASYFRRLRKLLKQLEPSASVSQWSAYASSCPSYSQPQRQTKHAFVYDALHTMSAGSVLDVGANDGEYSLLAASLGASVVAIDSDPAVCGRLFVEARAQGANVLPLVVDFARPSPAVGWRCAEQEAFLDRAEKAFDAVLMLAVLHHLLVTEQVPLDQILTVASQLTRRWLLIEYVEPGDAMFRKLARGRDAMYGWLTREAFLEQAAEHFDIVDWCDVPGAGRSLYLMQLRRPLG